MKDRELLTTPAEIAGIADKAAMCFEIGFACNVFEEYRKAHRELDTGGFSAFPLALTAVYVAGRVQGMREERARHAAK